MMVSVKRKDGVYLLQEYQNGNYSCKIYSDGTKIRFTEEDSFNPEFPESMDIHISDKCVNGCEYCYAKCHKDGKHSDLWQYTKLLNSIHPYTEIAIDLNNLDHSQLPEFLRRMKAQNVIVNGTINQVDFEKQYNTIKYWTDCKMLWGLGVSMVKATDDFIAKIQAISNAIIHIINGVTTQYELEKLYDKNLKVLVLGYKTVGRGISFLESGKNKIIQSQKYLYDNLANFIKRFKVACFDNLALVQLDVKRVVPDKDWESSYMGKDSEFSYYLDLVNGTYACNSLSETKYPIGDMDTVEIFKKIRGTCDMAI